MINHTSILATCGLRFTHKASTGGAPAWWRTPSPGSWQTSSLRPLLQDALEVNQVGQRTLIGARVNPLVVPLEGPTQNTQSLFGLLAPFPWA